MESWPTACHWCPRRCGQNRKTQPGQCHGGGAIRVARAAPHHWEEPCLSGTNGSGTVFFSGCSLGCLFCQNHTISRSGTGRPHTSQELADTFLNLQAQGVHNINLVTPTHYRPPVQNALRLAKKGGLALPVIWNTGGYETVEAVRSLQNDVNIWLFDLKFYDSVLSAQLAGAPDYFSVAFSALQEVCTLWETPVFSTNGLLQRGVIVRLLVLPGHRKDTKRLLHEMAAHLPKDKILLSLMSQYTPPDALTLPRPLGRRLSTFEYNDVADTARALGFTQGYFQRRSSAQKAFVPPFAGEKD